MDPQGVYASRLDTRREEQAVLERRDRSLSIARGIVGAIVVLALVALGWVRSLAVVLGLATLAFVVLVVVHERVARQLARARRRVAFYEAALDRVRWRLDRPWRARRALPRSASSLRRRPRSLRPRLAVRAPLRRANPRGTGPARVLAPERCSPRRRARAPTRVGRAGPPRRPARGHGRAGRRGAPRGRLEDARGLGPGTTRCGARGPARARIRLLGRGARRPAGHRPVGTAPVLPRDGRRRVLRMARAAVQPGGAGRHRPAGPRPPGARRDLRSAHRRAVRVAPPGGAAHGALRRG